MARHLHGGVPQIANQEMLIPVACRCLPCRDRNSKSSVEHVNIHVSTHTNAEMRAEL